MKQEIEQIIKKNLPEKKVGYCKLHSFTGSEADRGMCEDCAMEELEHSSFNQALSQINTSLIADEVLKVVVEKLCPCRCHLPLKTTHLCPNCFDGRCLLSTLSPNKENKNNG